MTENPKSPIHCFEMSQDKVARNGACGEKLLQEDSVFSLGNGFIGVRGVREESGIVDGTRASDVVYLNGVFEQVPITYYEAAFGFSDQSDVRIPVVDCSGLTFQIDGENVPCAKWLLTADERSLDMSRAVLTRSMTFTSLAGTEVSVELERFVSFAQSHLVAAQCRVRSKTFAGVFSVHAHVIRPFQSVSSPDEHFSDDAVHDPRLSPAFESDPWYMSEISHTDETWAGISATQRSGITVATSDMILAGATAPVLRGEVAGGYRDVSVKLAPGDALEFSRVTVYAAAFEQTDQSGASSLLATVQRAAGDAANSGYATLKEDHVVRVRACQVTSAVATPDVPEIGSAINFNTLQLLMSVGKDGRSSIGAKGQTGEGYEGHVFWDAEVFALPYFSYTQPVIARSMLMYRYSMLDDARSIARTMAHTRGALYPWRTISGRECSAFFPAGTAQYHINADIAYGIETYFNATRDVNFLVEAGAEMLIETARIWLQTGFFNGQKNGAFCINCVTGPDEYSALVDNNLYTNAMAAGHLKFTVRVMALLQAERSDAYAELCKTLRLEDRELEAFGAAAAAMYLPFSDAQQIYLQDEHFLEKKLWDFQATPPEKYPLLLHYHPLIIYRHQVCKQADAVLAMFLRGDQFDPAYKLETLDYYERVTTHDSTLSPGTFAIMRAECGDLQGAFEHLNTTAFIDLDNLSNNADHGLHMAAMANSWHALVFGFGGMRTFEGKLSFAPKYFERLGAYAFKVTFLGRLIEVAVRADEVTLTLQQGAPLEIDVLGQPRLLDAAIGQSICEQHEVVDATS